MKQFRTNKPSENRPKVNHLIRVPELQIIDDTGNNLGTMKTFEAMRIAQDRGLDLVEIGPNAKPPIGKIMDFGKYLYQREKKKEGGKSKSASQEVKTVKIGFRTNEHDMTIRASQADKFLSKGHRVIVNLILRGREKAMASLGEEKIKKFPQFLQESFEIESPVKRFPMGFTMTIKPAKVKK